jgi:hypothetical protein
VAHHDAPRSGRRPSRWFYAVPVAALLAGIALILTGVLWGLLGWSGQARRVVAPGRTAITFRDPGRYLVAYEYRSVLDGRVYATPVGIPSLRLELIGPDERPVPIGPSSGSFNYRYGSRAGLAIAEFTLDRPGRYVLDSAYLREGAGPNLVLAVGHDPLANLVPSLPVGLALILLVMPLTGGLVLFLRSRRKVTPVHISSLPLPPPARPPS